MSERVREGLRCKKLYCGCWPVGVADEVTSKPLNVTFYQLAAAEGRWWVVGFSSSSEPDSA